MMEQENEKTEIVNKNENKENKTLKSFKITFCPGGRGNKKNLIQGGSVPRCDPLPFIFLAQKIAFSYTFH